MTVLSPWLAPAFRRADLLDLLTLGVTVTEQQVLGFPDMHVLLAWLIPALHLLDKFYALPLEHDDRLSVYSEMQSTVDFQVKQENWTMPQQPCPCLQRTLRVD